MSQLVLPSMYQSVTKGIKMQWLVSPMAMCDGWPPTCFTSKRTCFNAPCVVGAPFSTGAADHLTVNPTLRLTLPRRLEHWLKLIQLNYFPSFTNCKYFSFLFPKVWNCKWLLNADLWCHWLKTSKVLSHQPTIVRWYDKWNIQSRL